MNWISGKNPELVFFDASGTEALRENVEGKHRKSFAPDSPTRVLSHLRDSQICSAGGEDVGDDDALVDGDASSDVRG